jgi:hypothetical protein
MPATVIFVDWAESSPSFRPPKPGRLTGKCFSLAQAGQMTLLTSRRPELLAGLMAMVGILKTVLVVGGESYHQTCPRSGEVITCAAQP